ncbi:hypothetical protein F5888DRAFT_363008 [Russula emetica]|nr:hypothetical protein F5888DRAFT_363008 [Russula emetica]
MIQTASAFTTLNLWSNTRCLDGESLKKRRVLGGWSTTLSAGLSMSELNLTLTRPFLACSFIIRPWSQSASRTALHLRLSRAEIYTTIMACRTAARSARPVSHSYAFLPYSSIIISSCSSPRLFHRFKIIGCPDLQRKITANKSNTYVNIVLAIFPFSLYLGRASPLVAASSCFI